MTWRKMGPREYGPLKEEVARADIDGEELILCRSLTSNEWIVDYANEYWVCEDVLRSVIDSFLDSRRDMSQTGGRSTSMGDLGPKEAS